MKGVILAGGKGSRLYPVTASVGKGLLPIYNKPMVFYGLSLLFSSGINDISLVCTERDYPAYKRLLADRFKEFGININITIEYEAKGPANALKLVKDEIKGNDIALIFCDNLFVSPKLSYKIKKASKNLDGVVLFAKEVPDPERFGVIETDENDNVLSIEEKPEKAKSNLVTTGLMLYSKDMIDKLEQLKPSKRGEYETTDLNNMFLQEGRAKFIKLEKDCLWLDTGTHDSLLESSYIIKNYEEKNKVYGCPEISLFEEEKIDYDTLKNVIKSYPKDYQQAILQSVVCK